MINGKAAVVGLLTIIGIIAVVLGPQLLYSYEDSGIKYDVYLESFVRNGDRVSGSILLKVTNNNDFTVTVSQISLQLYDPAKENPFLSISDSGASVDAGSTIERSKDFGFLYSEMPDTEIRAVVTAYVTWDGEDNWVTREIYLPISWSGSLVLS